MLSILFAAIFIHNDRVLKIDYDRLLFQEMILKEEIIDYSMQDLCYVLTSRTIYCIDTSNFRIVDRTSLPQKFNYVMPGQDEIFLIATSEIIVLNKNNLSFKTGIGIEPGDYQPMVAPVKLPQKDLIFLIGHNENRSIIKVIDRKNGRSIKRVSFVQIKKFYYLPEQRNFAILTQSGIHILDLNLKIKKSIKFNFPGEDFFVHNNGYIITGSQGICSIDTNGKIIDFQPVLLAHQAKNSGLVFWNDGFVILIDPITLRVKKIFENSKGICAIYFEDYEQSHCINKNAELYLLDNKTGDVKIFEKEEYVLMSDKEKKGALEDSLFYIQFGAFSDYNYAQSYSDSMRKMGLPAFIDSSIDSLYRVKLGGFFEKKLPLKIMDDYQIPGWIVYQKKIDFEIDTLVFFNKSNFYFHNGIIIEKE
ncbi:MAG: SPOR domain-containing protein [bacterium]